MPKRIMALDVGEKTIGIALTDPSQMIASPHSTIRRTTLKQDLEQLRALIELQDIGEIIVGMPRSLSGDLHFQAELTLRFIDHLKAAVETPIRTWDERFSSAEADRIFELGQVPRSRRKQIIDQTAAALILQGYLASRPPERSEPTP